MQTKINLPPHQVERIRKAAALLEGQAKIEYQQKIVDRLCGGSPRVARSLFGWKSAALKKTTEHTKPLPERWEVVYPELPAKIREIIAAHEEDGITAYGILEALQADATVPRDSIPQRNTLYHIMRRMGLRSKMVWVPMKEVELGNLV